MTDADLRFLLDVEQALVATGRPPHGGPFLQPVVSSESGRGAQLAEISALLAAGYITEPTPGRFGLTAKGWRVVHALREHVAAGREAWPTTIPGGFVVPDDLAVEDLAREIHVRRAAADPGAAPSESFGAARAFEAARKLARPASE